MEIGFLTALKKHIAGPKSRHRFFVRHGEQIALGLLIVVISLINLVWIVQDTRPQPGADPCHYLIKTLEFIDTLKEQGSAQLRQSVVSMSLQGRPPLYQLLSVPFIHLIGRSEDAALSVNFFFETILLLSTYGIGRHARNGKAGLLAAFLVATYPPIINLSRIYRPHSAVPACVALSLWLLLLVLKTRSVKIAWLFGASLGFGMLIHLNFFYLLPGPTIIFSLYMLLFQIRPRIPTSLSGTPCWLLTRLRDPFVLFGLVPAALIAVGFVVSWYLPQGQAILALRQAVVANWVGEAYGFPGVPHSFWWYALTMPGAISNVFAVLLVVGLVVCTLKRRLGPIVLVITFLVMYGTLGLRLGDLAWLHFAPVLPVAAVLTAVGVVDICSWLSPAKAGPSHMVRQGQVTRCRGKPQQTAPETDAREKIGHRMQLTMQARLGRPLSTVLTLVCVGVAVFNFSVVTWGAQPWSQPIASALDSPLDTRTCLQRMTLAFCPSPARHEDWRVSDALRAILDDPECQERGCHLTVVPKHESFGPFTFDLHLVRDSPEYGEKIRVSSADGWAGIPGSGEWVVSDYLVYIPHPLAQGTDRGRKIRLAMTRFLESPSPVFASMHQEVASFALPGGWTAKLIKRTEPLTVDVMIRSYEETLERVSSDVALYERLGYLNLGTGNESGAEELFQQAARIDPTLGWPHRTLGYLYQQQGLEDQATAEFWEAIHKEPFGQQAYRSLADLFQARGDLQEAIQVYELAVQKNPRSVWPFLELGSLYVRDNRLPEALAVYQVAARMEPRNRMIPTKLQNVHWCLSSGLGTAKAYADHTSLVWWLSEAWVRPYPHNQDVLVGRSSLDVEGLTRPDQIHMHPFSADQATYLRFDVEHCHYDAIQIGYGLADRVAALSNGVRYSLQASVEGGNSHMVLLDETVTGSGWILQTLPLIAYWGEDVTFQLVVDALGDDSHDWLQTTVRLFPALEVWDLAANLAVVQVATTDEPLSWNGSSAWVDADGRQLVNVSQALVQGTARDNQVQFHPFSSDYDTGITLVIASNPYSTLKTRYALADEAVGRSDGVDYAVAVSTDGGRTYVSLLQAKVSQNIWTTETLDLSAYLGQDLTTKLVSSSRGHESFDWLQVTLDLIVARNGP